MDEESEYDTEYDSENGYDTDETPFYPIDEEKVNIGIDLDLSQQNNDALIFENPYNEESEYETTDNEIANSVIDNSFIPPAPPGLPPDLQIEKERIQDNIMAGIRKKEEREMDEVDKSHNFHVTKKVSPTSDFKKKLEGLLSGKIGSDHDDQIQDTLIKSKVKLHPEGNERFESAKANLAVFLNKAVGINPPSIPPPPTSPVPPREVSVSHYFQEHNDSLSESGMSSSTDDSERHNVMIEPPNNIPPFYFTYQFPPLLEEQDLIRHCSLSQTLARVDEGTQDIISSIDLDFSELKLIAIHVCHQIYTSETPRNFCPSSTILLKAFTKFLTKTNANNYIIEQKLYSETVIPLLGYNIMSFDLKNLKRLQMKDLEISIENFIDTFQYLECRILREILQFDKQFLFNLLSTLGIKKYKHSFTINFIPFLTGLVNFYDIIFFQSIERTIGYPTFFLDNYTPNLKLNFIHNFNKFGKKVEITQESFVEELNQYKFYLDNLNKVSQHRRYVSKYNFLVNNEDTTGIKSFKELDFTTQKFIRAALSESNEILDIFFFTIKRIFVDRFIIPRLTTKLNIKEGEPIYFNKVLEWFQTVLNNSYFDEAVITIKLENLFILANGLYFLLVLNYFLGDSIPIKFGNNQSLLCYTNSCLYRLGLPGILGIEENICCFYLLCLLYERFKNMKPSPKRSSKANWADIYNNYIIKDHIQHLVEEKEVQPHSSMTRDQLEPSFPKDIDIPVVHRKPPKPPVPVSQTDSLSAYDLLDTHDANRQAIIEDHNPFLNFPELNLLQKNSCNRFFFRLVGGNELIWSVLPSRSNGCFNRSRDVGRLDLSLVSNMRLMSNRLGLKEQAYIAFYVESKPFNPVCGLYALADESSATKILYKKLQKIPALKRIKEV